MSTQPEALMLAEVLMHLPAADAKGHAYQSKATAELRRLHNEVTDLKQALEIADAVFKERDKLDSVNADLLEALQRLRKMCTPELSHQEALMCRVIDAAIAKAQE